MELSSAYSYCKQLARSHDENFPVASLIVPRRLRPHFYAVYAYCRVSDDMGDEGDPASRSAALAEWEEQLARALRGDASHPVLIALSDTASTFRIPSGLLFDLLKAFKQDQVKTRYANEEELFHYCRYSANPVGRIVLHLIGCARDENLPLSDSICTGLQLANFAQDVSVDLTKNRLYIPLSEMEAHGLTEADLKSGVETDRFARVMRVQVERARRFLMDGLPLSRRLGLRSGIEIKLICLGGLRILEKIQARGYRVLSRRPTLERRDFAGLLLRLAS